jgi:predicted XRE-type DNA-binding protein
MTTGERAIVLFGDVVDSRMDPAAATAWLRTLCMELEMLYAEDRVAGFGFTQGDELQGLLAPSADPFRAVLHAGLHDGYRVMRWAVAAGPIEAGTGPATERSGQAFIAARQALGDARHHHDRLVVRTGDPRADALLDDIAPLLVELLDGMSDKQRVVARLLVGEGLRQAEAADRLGVARATISVVARRARARSIGRLTRALRTIFAEGIARSEGAEATA